jgi:hypothetical protein
MDRRNLYLRCGLVHADMPIVEGLNDGQAGPIQPKRLACCQENVSGIPFLGNPHVTDATGDHGADAVKDSDRVAGAKMKLRALQIDVHGASD